MTLLLLAASAVLLSTSPQTVLGWREGALYDITAQPGRVTDIALQPGETLSPVGGVAAGDTVRWIIGQSESGAGATRQVHVLVKPTEPGITTNLVIATDRRSYHLEVRSLRTAYMASVSWRYPETELIALRGAPAVARPQGPTTGGELAAPGLDTLNFGYRIEGKAPWRPVRVFDDGRQTAIDFGPRISSTELPPLFVLNAAGAPELVNYRIKGRRMVVDRLFKAAELRLGAESRQTVVRLIREDGTAGR